MGLFGWVKRAVTKVTKVIKKGAQATINVGKKIYDKTVGKTFIGKTLKQIGNKLKDVSNAVFKFTDGVIGTAGNFILGNVPGLEKVWTYAKAFTPVGDVTGAYNKAKVLQKLIMNGKIPSTREMISFTGPLNKAVSAVENAKLVSADVTAVA